MEGERKRKEIVVDVRGQVCPSTLLVALDHMNNYEDELFGGTMTLIILTDNRNAITTIPGTVKNMGYEVSVEKPGKHYRIAIGRS